MLVLIAVITEELEMQCRLPCRIDFPPLIPGLLIAIKTKKMQLFVVSQCDNKTFFAVLYFDFSIAEVKLMLMVLWSVNKNHN